MPEVYRPTHFRGGVSNTLPGDNLYELGVTDESKWISFWDDFQTYTAGFWTVTETDAGATQALTDGLGGWLLVTNTAADDDLVSMQKLGESFKWSATKRMFFKCRFKVSDATQSDLVMGLQITDTTPLDVTDGIFFIKADAAATMALRVEKNNTGTTASVSATIVADTFISLGFFYNPNDGLFHIFTDDVEIGTVASTNAVDDEELTVTMAIQNGEGVAKTMTVDYIGAWLER